MDLLKKLQLIQNEIGFVKKDATNPYHNSSYSTLKQVLMTVNPVLEVHKMGLKQRSRISPKENTIVIETTVFDLEDGENDSMELEITQTKGDPQATGSAITYGRRYSIILMLGLESEDDDGNSTNENYKIYEKAINKLAEEAPTIDSEVLKQRTDKALETVKDFKPLVAKVEAIKKAYNV